MDEFSYSWGIWAIMTLLTVGLAVYGTQLARSGALTKAKDNIRFATVLALVTATGVLIEMILYALPPGESWTVLIEAPLYIVAFFGLIIAHFQSWRWEFLTERWATFFYKPPVRTCGHCNEAMFLNKSVGVMQCSNCGMIDRS